MDNEELAIEPLEVTDLDEALTLEVTCSSDPWSKNMFLGEMRSPLGYCFGVRWIGHEHPMLGFICFRNIGEESELLNICIHPRYRQKGIGKRLIEFYVEFCRQRQVKRFYLEVNASNQPAIHLYRSFSYQSVGVRPKFYERKFDALLMMKEDKPL